MDEGSNQGLDTVEFVNTYLAEPISVNVNDTITQIILGRVRTEGDGHHPLLELLAHLLSKLSESDKDAKSICFVDSHQQPPASHPIRGHIASPDLSAVYTTIWDRLGKKWPVPWHHILSVVEWIQWNPDDTSQQSQAGELGGSHNLANPQNPSVLVLSASPNHYMIGYSDPSAYTHTSPISWKNLSPLLAYLHTVIHPRHRVLDPSITLHNPHDFRAKPLWHIGDPTVPVNGIFKLQSIGQPQSRMTAIFRNTKIELGRDDIRFIKDAYPKINRYVSENELYSHLTKGGTTVAPGWVRTTTPKSHDPPQTHLRGPKQREKHRTAMLDSGETLMGWERLSDVFKGMYDVLEALRVALDQGVMHRDISVNNILVKPTTPSHPVEGDRAVFVTGVLSGRRTEASQILLFDLDAGTLLRDPDSQTAEKMDRRERDLQARTGTPMFMAMTIIRNKFLRYTPDFPEMPTFTDPKLQAIYNVAYGDDPLRMLSGTLGAVNHDLFSKRDDMTVKNMPWHDAESTFWTLVIHLLRRLPKASPIESREDLTKMNVLYLQLRNATPGGLDIRLSLLRVKHWEAYFHPAFGHIVPILREMADFIADHCYEFLTPKACIKTELVLYEAFQRILLRTVYQFEKGLLEDVELDTKRQRKVYTEGGRVMRLTTSKPASTRNVVGVKRKGENSAEEEQVSKVHRS